MRSEHPSETSLTGDRGARFRYFTCIHGDAVSWDLYRIFCQVRETVDRVSSKEGGAGEAPPPPPQIAQLPPQTDPASPQDIANVIIKHEVYGFFFVLSSIAVAYDHVIRELPPQDEISR